MEETKEDKFRQASRLEVIQGLMETGYISRDVAKIYLDMHECFSLDEYLKIRDTGLYKLMED